jgi:hypothetical protein
VKLWASTKSDVGGLIVDPVGSIRLAMRDFLYATGIFALEIFEDILEGSPNLRMAGLRWPGDGGLGVEQCRADAIQGSDLVSNKLRGLNIHSQSTLGKQNTPRSKALILFSRRRIFEPNMSSDRVFRFPKLQWLNSANTRTAGVYIAGALVRLPSLVSYEVYR